MNSVSLIPTFYLKCACTKPGKWAAMYMWAKGYRFVFRLYLFAIGFWNCFDSVVFVFHLMHRIVTSTQSVYVYAFVMVYITAKRPCNRWSKDFLPFRSTWVNPCVSGVHVAQSYASCWSLFVLFFLAIVLSVHFRCTYGFWSSLWYLLMYIDRITCSTV